MSFPFFFLVLFAASGFITSVFTFFDLAKRGILAKLAAPFVLCFGFFLLFAIPAQVFIDLINDQAADIQLDFDSQLLKKFPDRKLLARDIEILKKANTFSAGLRRLEFPDSLMVKK